MRHVYHTGCTLSPYVVLLCLRKARVFSSRLSSPFGWNTRTSDRAYRPLHAKAPPLSNLLSNKKEAPQCSPCIRSIVMTSCLLHCTRSKRKQEAKAKICGVLPSRCHRTTASYSLRSQSIARRASAQAHKPPRSLASPPGQAMRCTRRRCTAVTCGSRESFRQPDQARAASVVCGVRKSILGRARHCQDKILQSLLHILGRRLQGR